MQTTMIQLKKITAEKLKMFKSYKRQSYDEIINKLIQEVDEEPLTEQEIKEIEEGLEDVKAGKVESIEKVAKGWTDFDVAVATPGMMKSMAKIARVLGPKGLMPSPKAGTVVANIPQAVEEFKKGKMEFKLDKTGNINAAVGKISFTEAQIEENIKSFLKALEDNKPTGVKGKLIKKVFIAPTMGPSIQIEC